MSGQITLLDEIDKLNEQLEIISGECSTYKKMSDNMANEIVILKEQNKKLRECIEWYGENSSEYQLSENELKYLKHGVSILLDESELDYLSGKTARKCLEEIEKL